MYVAMIDHMSLANNAPATQISCVPGVRQLILSKNQLPEDYTVQQIKTLSSKHIICNCLLFSPESIIKSIIWLFNVK